MQHPMRAPATLRPRPISQLMWSFAPILVGVAAFSGVINILALSGSIYMLQIYDRVLPSQSVPTLVGLSVLLAGLYVISGALDWLRARIMVRVGNRLDAALSPRVFRAVQVLPLRTQAGGDGMQPMRDLDSVRSFMSGLGLPALLDLPWIPVYLLFVYILHPALALVAVLGALFLVALTLLTEYRSASPMRDAAAAASQRFSMAEAVRRNAEAIQAMGLSKTLGARYDAVNKRYLGHQLEASDAAGGIGNATKVFRLLLQSAVLGFGAYLVIHGELSPGAIIAASIAVSRALAPVETAIAHWKGFVSARLAAGRLNELLLRTDEGDKPVVDLPKPRRELQAETLVVAAPGQKEPIIRNVSFTLQAADALGVIGPSGSGKSTLARALVGVWPSIHAVGSVRLDGAALEQWSSENLGRHVGYMPQDVELFSGTIAENISRFDPDADSEAIVASAKAAGSHDMIVRLSEGYQTRVGEGGRALSAGERQRVALARALFGEPFLVVLDEPNSNLDASGDAALTEAVLQVRRRGGIAIVIAHRPSALAAVNKVLVLANGQTRDFGPKDEVLRSVLQTVSPTGDPHGAQARVDIKDSA